MLILSILAGISLGIIYFGGLWYTVNMIAQLRRPWIFITVSFLARNAIVLVGFYFLLIHHWSNLAGAFIAFILIRQVMISSTSPGSKKSYG